MKRNHDRSEHGAGANETKVYLVGGGITSLAAAAFLIRDANVPGHNITILEELDRLGGSLDGTGSPQEGYVLCGGRMLESKYLCTYDLFSSIPTLDQTRTVTKEIFDWNETTKMSSQSRLVRAGRRESAPAFGLSEKHILTLKHLMVEPGERLGKASIADHFDPEFFATHFWLMWCTTFAFQPWHSAMEFKRCLLRFTHMLAGFNQLHGIMGTVYNHYDSMVRPLQRWLEARGVCFALNTRVKNLASQRTAAGKRVECIVCEHNRRTREIILGAEDLVIVTLGSRTEASSLGSMEAAPVLKDKTDGGPWALGKRSPRGGRNSVGRRPLPATSTNPNLFPSRLPCAIQPSSGSSGISLAICRARVGLSLLRTPAGWLRLCYPINRTLSGNRKTWTCSGAMDSSSTNRATS